MEDGGDLWDELSGLADSFADLGRRLLSASRQLHVPGALPSPALLAEVDDLRAGFESLRGRVVARAEVLGVAVPRVEALGDVKGLALLLEAVDEAEARREGGETRVTPAPAVDSPAAVTVALTTVRQLNIHFPDQLTVYGLSDESRGPVPGDDVPPGDDAGAAIDRPTESPTVPAGPGVPALRSPGWAGRFPRLAAGWMSWGGHGGAA